MPLLKKLKVATFPVPHFIEISKNEDGHQELSGVEGLFLKTILSLLRLEYEVIIPSDNAWGIPGDNGNWSGIIGMVRRDEADIGFGALVLTEERMRAADISTAYATGGFTFVSRKPTDISRIFAFVYPFDVTTWSCLFTTLILISILFKLFQRGNESFSYIVMNFFGSLLMKPSYLKAHSRKWKMLVTLWSSCGVVVSASYSSALLSFLTVPLQGTPIKNFRQLSEAVQKGTHKCYTMRGSHSVPLLRGSSEQYLRSLGETIVQRNWYLNNADIGSFKNVAPNSIEILDNSLVRLIFENNDLVPDLMSSGDIISITLYGLIMNKNFCCKRKLNTVISRMLAAGIVEKLRRDESMNIKRFKSENEFNTDKNKKLSFGDLSGTFMFLLIGLIVSFFVLIAEIVVGRKTVFQ